jgi:hypothetical protein
MNFSLYLDDQIGKELDRTAKKLGEIAQRVDPQGAARMAGQEGARWSGLADIDPGVACIPDIPPFESNRGEVLAPREDAFS